MNCTQPPDETQARNTSAPEVPPCEPLACRRCGALTYPSISPGTGPHAWRANCPDCGGFMKWLSRFTPAEPAARRERARLDAMARQAPPAPQLAYLHALGDRGPAPANRAEASQRIDALRRERGVA